MNEEEILRRAREEDRSELAVAMLRLAEALAKQREWMTADEAAEFLRFTPGRFRTLAACGEIPRHRISPGRFRYYAPELTEWLLAA
jgi:hypothetical protein